MDPSAACVLPLHGTRDGQGPPATGFLPCHVTCDGSRDVDPFLLPWGGRTTDEIRVGRVSALVAGSKRLDDLGRRHAPFGEEHERVIQEVGRLAGEGFAGRLG